MEELVLQIGGMLCLSPKCGMFLLLNDPQARGVHCPQEFGGCGVRGQGQLGYGGEGERGRLRERDDVA